MGPGSGFGKTILFGEHFVVYKTPGIAAALDLATDAHVLKTNSGGLQIEDLRKGAPGYVESKQEMQQQSLLRIFKHLGIGAKDVKIRLSGSLPAFSGIGASGASCVAIIRALSSEFGLNLTDDQVNEAAHEGERAYHGENTAGIDNMASTFGGLIFFRKGNPSYVEHLKLKKPLEIIIADTGITANTKVMIEGVLKRKLKNSKKYDRLIQTAQEVIEKGKQALLNFDLEMLGSLMNENHHLLQEIEVSCKELDFLVELARSAGAFGAKQTGSGGGGCIVALTPGKDLQAKVARTVEEKGFAVLRTRIGI
ncbi:MAG: mevalonate kinase [Spirochaetota bacterium]